MKRIEINKDNSKIVYDVIPKQKIRDKIKELDEQQKQFKEDRKNKHTDREIKYAIEVLEELLGE